MRSFQAQSIGALMTQFPEPAARAIDALANAFDNAPRDRDPRI
ncbi:hypothetical protein [Pengzhenrongella sp.]